MWQKSDFRAHVLVEKCANVDVVEEPSGGSPFGGVDLQGVHAPTSFAMFSPDSCHLREPTIFRSGALSPYRGKDSNGHASETGDSYHLWVGPKFIQWKIATLCKDLLSVQFSHWNETCDKNLTLAYGITNTISNWKLLLLAKNRLDNLKIDKTLLSRFPVHVHDTVRSLRSVSFRQDWTLGGIGSGPFVLQPHGFSQLAGDHHLRQLRAENWHNLFVHFRTRRLVLFAYSNDPALFVLEQSFAGFRYRE